MNSKHIELRTFLNIICFIVTTLIASSYASSSESTTTGSTLVSLDTRPLYTYFWKTLIEPPNRKGFPHLSSLFVILTPCQVENVQKRRIMRNMTPIHLLKKYFGIRVFLLGSIPPSVRNITQQQIEDEGNTYGDILQGSFVDDYRELTHKHLMGLKWAATAYTRARFIVKSNEDISLNYSILDEAYTLLIDVYNSPKSNFLMGFVQKNRLPERRKQVKYYVSWKEYPKFMFPHYLIGLFYVTTPLVAARLCEEAVNHPYLYLDDVFVTGILAQALNIERRDITNTECWFENYDYEAL